MALRALALATTVLALAACSGGTAPQETAGPDPVVAAQNAPADLRLRLGGSAQVGTASPLTVTFRDVAQDSRCPIDVQCPWAGDAEIELRLSHNGRSATALLHTNGEPKQVEYDGYVVQLLAVEPSKSAAREIAKSEYVVTVRVTKP